MEDKKLIEEDFKKRVQEVLAFAKEKEISISAVQRINENGCIEIVSTFNDLKQHTTDK